MLALLLLGGMVGLDNFRVAIGLGVLNLSSSRQMQIALMFGLFESLMPLVGLVIGRSLIVAIDPWAGYVGPVVLGGYGLYLIYLFLRRTELEHALHSRWVLLALPFSLSLDNLIVGIGLGILGFPVLLSAIVIGTVSSLMCLVGLRAGGAIRRYLPVRSGLVSGVALVVLAAVVPITDVL